MEPFTLTLAALSAIATAVAPAMAHSARMRKGAITAHHAAEHRAAQASMGARAPPGAASGGAHPHDALRCRRGGHARTVHAALGAAAGSDAAVCGALRVGRPAKPRMAAVCKCAAAMKRAYQDGGGKQRYPSSVAQAVQLNGTVCHHNRAARTAERIADNLHNNQHTLNGSDKYGPICPCNDPTTHDMSLLEPMGIHDSARLPPPPWTYVPDVHKVTGRCWLSVCALTACLCPPTPCQ